jgi:hypothetical protein
MCGLGGAVVVESIGMLVYKYFVQSGQLGGGFGYYVCFIIYGNGVIPFQMKHQGLC